MSAERVCQRYRCEYYKKDNESAIGITNCTGTAWNCNCILSCTFHNYGMGLNPTFENTNGDYVPPEGGNS